MIELTEIHMGKEREESAKSFIERLANEDDLVTAVSALDDVMCISLRYAMDLGVEETKKNNDCLSMIYYLDSTINALKYIGTHDVLKPDV